MKTVLTVAVLSALGLATGAASAADYADVATVISATPIVERVAAPRRECFTEQVTSYDERRVRAPVRDEYVSDSRGSSGAGTILGAIIGGVVGHQFGNSSGGRDHGTAAGAIVGGLIGNSVDRENARSGDGYDGGYRRASSREYAQVERIPVTHDVQRCNVVAETREEIRGYDVRYRYHNREYTTRLSYDPGPTMPVNVEVRPSYRASVPSYNRY